MNIYICSGNLTKDPELRTLGDGKTVTTLRLAVNTGRDQAIFLNVTVWDKPAENCCKYLAKGSPVMVKGELKEARVYTSKSGEARADLEITAARYGGVEFGRNDDSPSRPSVSEKKPHDYRGTGETNTGYGGGGYGSGGAAPAKSGGSDEWTPF